MLTLVACTPSSESTPEIPASKTSFSIGWMHGNCLAIKNEVGSEAFNFYAVDLETNDVLKLRAGKKALTGDECYALLEDRFAINTQDERQFYTVMSDKPLNFAIGIVYAGDRVKSIEKAIDLDNDGKRDSFTSCSTSEGMMFSVWDGEAYKSKLIWSDYYYLGYDSEADCPEIK